MSLFSNPLRVKYIPVVRLYRASYKDSAAYGRTPRQAVDNVRRKHHNTRLSPSNILNAIGISFLPF
jgi:hypothetical protein